MRQRAVRIDPAGPPIIRQAAKGGPTAVMQAHWRDPDDQNPNRRLAREVNGFRIICSLRKMQLVRGSEVEDRHIHAADLLRGQCDLAVIGRGGARSLELNQRGFGPISGPPGSATANVWALIHARRALNRLDQSGRELITAVVLFNHSIYAWCNARRADRIPADPRLEMGKLIQCLKILADHYEAEIDEGLKRGTLLPI